MEGGREEGRQGSKIHAKNELIIVPSVQTSSEGGLELSPSFLCGASQRCGNKGEGGREGGKEGGK